MSNSDQATLEPLVSTGAISDRAVEICAENFPSQPQPLMVSIAVVAMQRLRDVYEADRRRLYAQLVALQAENERLKAGRWRPVENGDYHYGWNHLSVDGNLFGAAFNGKPIYAAPLPDDIRLCRLQPAKAGKEGKDK